MPEGSGLQKNMVEPEKKRHPFSFPKADRILKRKEFAELSESGRKIGNNHFLAIVSKCEGENLRIGITVTRKAGNAVARNRIKRHVREFFRKNRHKLKKKRDINVIAHRRASELTSGEIRISLEYIFSIICRNQKS